MSAEALPAHEIRLALDILEPLTAGELPELVSADPDTLRFRIPRRLGWRLRTILFSRRSLQNLLSDVTRDVKIEYLQRDMLRVATSRATYRYPHTFGDRSASPEPARIAAAR